jgi:hypothetical protein
MLKEDLLKYNLRKLDKVTQTDDELLSRHLFNQSDVFESELQNVTVTRRRRKSEFMRAKVNSPSIYRMTKDCEESFDSTSFFLTTPFSKIQLNEHEEVVSGNISPKQSPKQFKPPLNLQVRMGSIGHATPLPLPREPR